MFGGIEAGGTKFVCGVGTGPDNIIVEEFPTSAPEVTLGNVIRFFKMRAGSSLEAVGIGSFGPVDLNPSSLSYGHITSTPKLGWANFDLAGGVKSALKVPINFDTEV